MATIYPNRKDGKILKNYKKKATLKAIIKREATRGKRRYGCTRRILSYRNDRKCLKELPKKE